LFYERLIFATKIERSATRQLIRDSFPSASIIDTPDDLAEDFILDVYVPVEKCIFFRWATSTIGPCRLLLYSCFTMSMEMYDPPPWMAVELRRLLKS